MTRLSKNLKRIYYKTPINRLIKVENCSITTETFTVTFNCMHEDSNNVRLQWN